MKASRLRVPLVRRPKFFGDGELAAVLPLHLVEKNDEMTLALRLTCNRPLFGSCYRYLAHDYFWAMPRGSGVFVACGVESSEIVPNMNFPGDIDLLVIPYEGNEFIISRTMAIELKIIRASYKNQGRSPSRFGFSQAEGLLEHGFPRAAVIHLIVSDSSPEIDWREVSILEIVDADTGKAELVNETKMDLLPVDLIERGFGRLKSNRTDTQLGVVSAYFTESGNWDARGLPCMPNSEASADTMERIGAYFHSRTGRFMDIPRHDPDPSTEGLESA